MESSRIWGDLIVSVVLRRIANPAKQFEELENMQNLRKCALFKQKKVGELVYLNDYLSSQLIFSFIVFISIFSFFGYIFLSINVFISIILLLISLVIFFGLIKSFTNLLILNFENGKVKYQTFLPFYYAEIDRRKGNKIIINFRSSKHVGQNGVFDTQAIYIETFQRNKSKVIANIVKTNKYRTLSMEEINGDVKQIENLFLELGYETQINL